MTETRKANASNASSLVESTSDATESHRDSAKLGELNMECHLPIWVNRTLLNSNRANEFT
jgi:hypothetical protein